ncbi:hypothetical protein CKO11_15660 [Rhodobacter sp. TJ_12]|uniref:GGDEF domain-containing protein n=1 Tax=Rhodobacter sp. TJ_12 TaxID=2029399 RepID=UPI001CBE9C45|nr:GGDEF domain-containing protein [Rhodobacter sp. TJ_12]MBZ4023889.1 hypothetical protein [Rhodobacter sp. TJ_12]
MLIAGQRLIEAGFPAWPVLVSPEIFSHWGLDLGFHGTFSTATARALMVLNGALLAARICPRLAVALVVLGWFTAAGALFKFSFSLFNEALAFSFFSLAAYLALLVALVLRHASVAPFRIFLAPSELRQPFLVMLTTIIVLPFLAGALLSHKGEFSQHHLHDMIFVFTLMDDLLMAVVLYTGATLSAQRHRLDHALHHDPLTEALNRRGLFEAIAIRPELNGLVLFDIDHFKRINDTLGHLEGDRVLHAVADTVRAQLTPGDVFARWGGEEFLVLVEGADTPTLAAKSETLRRAISEMGSREDDARLARVTASFGYGPRDPLAGDLAQALALTDQALQRAKKGGRNRCNAAVDWTPTEIGWRHATP